MAEELRANLEINVKVPKSKIPTEIGDSKVVIENKKALGSGDGNISVDINTGEPKDSNGFIAGENLIITRAEDVKNKTSKIPMYPKCQQLINYRNDIDLVKFELSEECVYKGNPYLYNFEVEKIVPENKDAVIKDTTTIFYKYGPTEFFDGIEMEDSYNIEMSGEISTDLEDSYMISDNFNIEASNDITDTTNTINDNFDIQDTK